MKNPIIPTALVALALSACGEAGPSLVTSSRELPEGVERTQAIRRAVEQALLRGVEAPEELAARAVIVDDDGTEHVRLDRSFRGMRVIGGDLVSHRREDGRPHELQLAGHGTLSAVAGVPLVQTVEALRRARGAFVGRLAATDSSELVVDARPDRKSTRLNSSHSGESRMPSSA